MPESPNRLIPLHIGGEVTDAHVQKATDALIERRGLKKLKGERLKAAVEDLPVLQELYRQRQQELMKAPDLEDELKKYATEKKIEVPPTVNLSLRFIEEFRRHAMEAQDMRKVVKGADDLQERALALRLFTGKKAKLQEYLAFGKSFERAYREFINARMQCQKFIATLNRLMELDQLQKKPTFQSLSEDAPLDARAHGRIEQLMRVQGDPQTGMGEALEALKAVYAEGSEEYQTLSRDLISPEQSGESQPVLTKKQITGEIARLRKEAEELWTDPMVRYLYNQRELDTLLADFSEGSDVIETQPIIRMLNEMHEWEQQHQRTTLGGALVGPPGVGKTTLVRHYLAAKKRGYVYMDLSEDVTRYLLYGSKSIEFKSTSDYYRSLIDDLSRLDDAGFIAFVKENASSMQKVFGPKAVQNDEAIAAFLSGLQKTLGDGESGGDEELRGQCTQMKGRLVQLVERHLRREIADQVAHIAEKPNGWRDGVVVSSLRNNQSLILDEFNKCKDLSLIYSLLTAEPASDEEAGPEPSLDEKSIKGNHKGWWYFADNREWIRIPQNWRMYFTANIGRKHGGFEVAEALASRAGGKIMEVGHPSPKQEMQVALAALANPEGDFLRSKDDLAKLYVMIHELFPKVRSFIQDRRQTIPISYRTIRDLGEKLVLYRDPSNATPVYHPTETSFDEALYEVLIESYALYEDKTVPKEVVSLATSVGLLLDDDSLKEKVSGWIGREAYDERKKTFAEHKDDFSDIVKKIRGLQDFMDVDTAPSQRQF